METRMAFWSSSWRVLHSTASVAKSNCRFVKLLTFEVDSFFYGFLSNKSRERSPEQDSPSTMTSKMFVRMNDTQLCTVASAFTSMFSCVKNGILELGRSSRSHSAWIVFSMDSFQTSPERGVQNKTHIPRWLVRCWSWWKIRWHKHSQKQCSMFVLGRLVPQWQK